MKFFFQYLKQHLPLYAVEVLFVVIFLITFLLYRLPLMAVLYPFLLCVIVCVVWTIFDFQREKRKHEILNRIKNITDALEIPLPDAQNTVDADYQKIIQSLCEEHKIFSTEANREYMDMVDYYTVWVHQIKTPIASMRLKLQNEDSAAARALYGDLHRIEQYVEMVLTFLRLNSEGSDYIIKEYDLDTIVKQAVKKFSHEFIGRKISLIYEPIHTTVVTDEKWLSFVLEQVLSNALKYTKNGSIAIFTDADKNLFIRDTGIGIAPEDLPRIFENGYTGFNGRTDKKASGIGLYLCKRICNNLGHGISVQSVVEEGTTVIIGLAHEEIEPE